MTSLKRFCLAVGLSLGLALPLRAAPTSPPAGNYITNVSTQVSVQSFKVSSGTISNQLSLPYLTPGQCTTTNAAGQVVGTPCGSGLANVAITTGNAGGFSTVTSSPTSVVNFDSTTFNVSLKGASTAYVTLSQSYLTISSAASTYLQTSSATATYVQASSAAATYVTLSSAAATYFQKALVLPVASGGTGTPSPGLSAGTNIISITGTWPNQTINAGGGVFTPGSTNYIQNTTTLQAGSTVYVTSATISGPLTVGGTGTIASAVVGQLTPIPGSSFNNTLGGSHILHSATGLIAGDNNFTYDGSTFATGSSIQTTFAGPTNVTGPAGFAVTYAVSVGSLTCTGLPCGSGGGGMTSGASYYAQINASPPLQSGSIAVASATVGGNFYVAGTTMTIVSSITQGNNISVATQDTNIVRLTNGYLLRVGGFAAAKSAVCDAFNPATSLWAATGTLNTSRYFSTTIALSTATLGTTGDALTCGGAVGGGLETTSCEIFHFGVWTATTSLPVSWQAGGMALLPNGQPIYFGGDKASGVNYSSAAYILQNGVWVTTTSMPSTEAFPSVFIAPKWTTIAGAIFAVGGDVNNTTVGSTCTYLLNGAWNICNTNYVGLSSSFNGGNGAMDSNGRIYTIGGSGPPTGTYSAVGEYLDPPYTTWHQISSNTLTTAHAWGAVFAEINNKVITMGGGSTGHNASVEVWEYDPSFNNWTQLNSLPVAFGYTSVSNNGGPQPTLLDGRFVTGGGSNDAGSSISTSMIYQPSLYISTLTVTSLILQNPLPVSSGGTGTTSPGLVVGTNITSITGTWPNQTINATTQNSGSGAEQTISYQPGLLSAVNATKGVFGKFVKASTVDNIEGSAITFSCISNPTITLFECGTSASCSASPVTIGTVTITSAGTVVDGTISSSAITAGDYIAWSMTAGTCASVDLSATAQVHAN